MKRFLIASMIGPALVLTLASFPLDAAEPPDLPAPQAPSEPGPVPSSCPLAADAALAARGCCQTQGGVCGCRNGVAQCCNGKGTEPCQCRADTAAREPAIATAR